MTTVRPHLSKRLLVQVGATCAATAILCLPVSAAGAVPKGPLVLTRGNTLGPWEVTVSATVIPPKLPGLCFAFNFGTGYGDGGTNCVAPARGHSVEGPPWTFDPGAQPYDGISPPTITRTSGGLRAIMFVVVRSASRVVIRLSDGEVLRLKPRPIPSRLHRPGGIAVSVRQVGKSLPPMVQVKSGVAYNARGNVVGRFSRRAPALTDFTYG